ncbi:MAG: hypothetical protein QOG68_2485 [Solirubrobacteraceae bacterium]|jgi:hypothetical protein|nr:hypothetical protein [Solirubrobacteraceae bacterium]
MFEKDLAAVLADATVDSGRRGLTFDDLARAAPPERTTLGDVVDWLAQARASGFVEELGFDPGVGGFPGPRRYRHAQHAGTEYRPTG